MVSKKEETKNVAAEVKADKLWRKPIMLDLEDDSDPLANLYRGREVAAQVKTEDALFQSPSDKENELKTASNDSGASESFVDGKKDVRRKEKPAKEKAIIQSSKQNEKLVGRETGGNKITESELKAILKIKSETFHFTDIREILRGKSLDMYAYLRHLCGESPVCKIKHLDLMKQLGISRPTLFKQGEWLTKLLLIEKQNVPGDHFGTSYTVHRLEETLPVPDALVEQFESHLKNLGEKLN